MTNKNKMSWTKRFLRLAAALGIFLAAFTTTTYAIAIFQTTTGVSYVRAWTGTLEGAGLNLADTFRLGGATGVNLSAATGVLTLAGIGGTFNEAVTLDVESISNTLGIASTSGITSITWTGNFTSDLTIRAGSTSSLGFQTRCDWSSPVDGELTTSNTAFTENCGIRARYVIEAVTTTKTPTALESREVYTNTGDADGSAITLLNDPPAGTQYLFVATAAQTVAITASAGESIEDSGATCGTSYTLTDGQSVMMLAATDGSGAQWHAVGGNGTCNA